MKEFVSRMDSVVRQHAEGHGSESIPALRAVVESGNIFSWIGLSYDKSMSSFDSVGTN